MTDNDVLNPYQSDFTDEDHLSEVSFAGRKMAFSRLYHQLTDPARQHALLFLGRRRVGKTAFLYAFDSTFSDSFVCAYVPLREISLDSTTDLMLGMAQAATAALIERGYILNRLNNIEPPGEQPRTWFTKVFLPTILSAVRAPRQLVFLLDDAERLIPAIRGGLLPEDTFVFFHNLMKHFQQVGFALTFDTEYEHDIAALEPLVTLNDVYRLTNLDEEDTRWLLQDPVQGYYTVPDDVAAAVYRATGGAPALVEQFGYQLFRRWEINPDLNVVTVDDIKSLLPKVYSYAEEDYRYLWSRLTLNERLVLTAISGLIYNDPLGRIDPAAIEAWLVETDYPMDITSINAALRSLEYREVVQPTPNGLMLTAEMLQAWLLENARLNERAAPVQAPSAGVVAPPATWHEEEMPRRRPRLLTLLAVAAIIGIILAAVVLVILSNTPAGEAILNPQPTVTLVGGG